MKQRKIALVHDYLNEAGGAERVLRVLAEMYPHAPIYVAFAKNGTAKKMFEDRQVLESPWGWLLKQGRLYSYLRFLLPFVWKSVDLSEYDVVITSCSGYIARGFGVGQNTKVIAYCHTPPKWLYGYETPTGGRKKWWGSLYLTVFGPWVRYFDFMSAQRVNVWMANSQEVARRIAKFYRKEAKVIYPPIEINTKYKIQNTKYGNYYLTVARVVGAKGLEEAAGACKSAKRELRVVGEVVSEQVAHAIKRAGGRWVTLVGRVSDLQLVKEYQGARGYIALARDEDLGMTVVEAMSYGLPIIALNSGGYKETVRGSDNQKTQKIGEIRSSADQKFVETGILIDRISEVPSAIKKLENTKWDREGIVKWAGKFDRGSFEKGVAEVVQA